MSQTLSQTRALTLDPDRLFPVEPSTREVARSLYGAVAQAPIYSPHGHVDAGVLVRDEPFDSVAQLLITPDHYVTRLLHANGVPLERLGLARDGEPSSATSKEIWAELCRNWSVFAGTPVRYWMQSQLVELFDISEVPDADNAGRLHDQISERLASPEFRPRALFERFGIAVLATTDAPADDLSAHRALADDPSFAGRVLPTFRADAYLDPRTPRWRPALEALADAADVEVERYTGVVEGLRARRRYFIEHGGTATDTGPVDCGCEPLDVEVAEGLHSKALRGEISDVEAVAYRGNMLYRLAELAAEDGLVMQLHPGVIRNHHAPTFDRFGPDSGHDVPAVGAFTEPLTPILRDFGTDPNFRLVLFTVDETVFSREIGPLAGFYPSVYAGAPWWFIDSPAAIARYRAAITDSAGFAKTSGFIDDTRAFCSIPARHDMSRRCDAAFLAGLVTSGQLTEEEAVAIAADLVDGLPRRVFKLG